MVRVWSLGTMPRNASFPSLKNATDSLASLRKGFWRREKSEDVEQDAGLAAGVFVALLVLVLSISSGLLRTMRAETEPMAEEPMFALPPTSMCGLGDEDCVLGRELYDRHKQLASFTVTAGAIDRPYKSIADLEASKVIQMWMEDAGMTTRVDIVGNVIGRYEADSETLQTKTLLMGSHYDSVSNAGKFDGVYGVLSAIASIKVLNMRGERLPFAVEIVAFDDEEGNNPFGTTNTGAKAFMGEYEREEAAVKLLSKYDGLEEALRASLVMRDLPASREDIIRGLREAKRDLNDVLGYVELHIEQGPVLEAHNKPIGVVTAINGQTRMQVRFSGQAGHAGTVPMNMRKDALIAAAQTVTNIERVGSSKEGMVATVGTLEVAQGSSNVVPGEVLFTVDMRGPIDAVREEAVLQVVEEIHAVAKRRGLEVSITKTHEAGAVFMDPELMTALRKAIVAEELEDDVTSVVTLSSGAGHDSMIIGQQMPVAMAFLRCEGGISHNPAEFLDPKDASAGANVLLQLLLNFANN